MKIYLSILLILLTSCSNIQAPSLILPTEHNNTQQTSFGNKPDNYQSILKNYLIKNLRDHKTAKVEFINEPSKLSINHLGDSYTGYRVCLSINEKRGDHYIGYKNHLFLINNDKVDLHLFDSGLLTIPFEYCVTRNIENEIFIDDIPDKPSDIAVDNMDDLEIKKRSNLIKNKDNLFIVCKFKAKSNTYIFNEIKRTFKLIDKLKQVEYALEFNDAFIVAKYNMKELTINRVTGEAIMEDSGDVKSGTCLLTNKTKF